MSRERDSKAHMPVSPSPTSPELQPEACHGDRDVSGEYDGDDSGGGDDG